MLINVVLWLLNEYIGLLYLLLLIMNFNLVLVNVKCFSFDVLDVKFIYKKFGEKD